MKIDEPKTPYAPHYNPSEDEEEGEQAELAEAEESLIDAQDVKVDELDRKKKAAGGAGSRRGVAEDEIPELELGESEEPLSGAAAADGLEGVGAGAERIVRGRSLSNDSSKGEKHVVVGEDGEADGDHLMTTDEAQAKHREFEQHRKKHYEMRNIRELLAYVSICFFVSLFLPTTELLLTGWITDTRRTWMKWMKWTKTTTTMTMTRMEKLQFLRRFLRSQNNSRRRMAHRVVHRFLTSVCFCCFWLSFLLMSSIIFPQRVLWHSFRGHPYLRYCAFCSDFLVYGIWTRLALV